MNMYLPSPPHHARPYALVQSLSSNLVQSRPVALAHAPIATLAPVLARSRTAALYFGASHAVAVEIDVEAIATSRLNAAENDYVRGTMSMSSSTSISIPM